jgi:hypothetical protein
MEIWTVFYDDSMIIWLGQKWGSYPQDHQNKKKRVVYVNHKTNQINFGDNLFGL